MKKLNGPKSYELMYGNGGHGGPWYGLDAALVGAELYLRGCRSENVVYIVPCDERLFDRRNAVRVIRRSELTPE